MGSVTPARQWVSVIDARDRALFDRVTLRAGAARNTRRGWVVVTHCGSAVATIGSALVPTLFDASPRDLVRNAAVALVGSHLLVQLVKRIVNRPRPTPKAVITLPDRFSFPSGHAAASLAIALSYALVFPAVGGTLIAFGLVVGWSRVMLGVHYPGDVVAGQLLAVLTVGLLQVAVWGPSICCVP